MQPLDPQVVNLAKAIRQTESGGDFTAHGKSGEYGAYQFTEPTWNKMAKAVGIETKLSDSTREEQNKVAYSALKNWKEQGYNPGQIASMWNAGEGEPDAYLGRFSDGSPSTGTNKYGVQFDVPRYAKSVKSAYDTIKGGMSVGVDPQNPSSVAAVQPQQQQKEGLGEQLKGRVNQFTGAISDAFSGKMAAPIVSGPLQAAGAVAGAVGDVVGAGISAVVPDSIENALGKGVSKIVNSKAGQKVQEVYGELPEEVRKDIAAAGNIATLYPIGKGLGVAGRAASEAPHAALKGLANTGGITGEIAKRRIFNEALEVVTPKATPKVVQKGIESGRGRVSGFSKNVAIEPDRRTLNAAEAAMGIVRKSRTSVENANAVRTEIGNVATKLEKDLASMDVTPLVAQDDMLNLMRNAMKKIGENPVLVGDAEESARRILQKFQSFLPEKGDITAGDILKARKKLDDWMESQTGGSNVFDPKFENAKSIALRAVRQEANELVAAKAPTVAVKGALARQSALYDALENISAKGVKEVGTGRIKRWAQRHPTAAGVAKIGVGVAGYNELQKRIPILPDIF